MGDVLKVLVVQSSRLLSQRFVPEAQVAGKTLQKFRGVFGLSPSLPLLGDVLTVLEPLEVPVDSSSGHSRPLAELCNRDLFAAGHKLLERLELLFGCLQTKTTRGLSGLVHVCGGRGRAVGLGRGRTAGDLLRVLGSGMGGGGGTVVCSGSRLIISSTSSFGTKANDCRDMILNERSIYTKRVSEYESETRFLVVTALKYRMFVHKSCFVHWNMHFETFLNCRFLGKCVS